MSLGQHQPFALQARINPSHANTGPHVLWKELAKDFFFSFQKRNRFCSFQGRANTHFPTATADAINYASEETAEASTAGGCPITTTSLLLPQLACCSPAPPSTPLFCLVRAYGPQDRNPFCSGHTTLSIVTAAVNRNLIFYKPSLVYT